MSSDAPLASKATEKRWIDYKPQFWRFMDETYLILLHKFNASHSIEPEAIKRHVSHLEQLEKNGLLICAGPFNDGSGGLLILQTESESDAIAAVTTDPFIQDGSHHYEIRPFNWSKRENQHLGWGSSN